MEHARPWGLHIPLWMCPCSQQERDAIDWERMEKAWTVRAETGESYLYRNREEA